MDEQLEVETPGDGLFVGIAAEQRDRLIEGGIEEMQPSNEILEKIRIATENLADYLKEENPHVLIFSGRSSILSRALLTVSGRFDSRRKVVKFSPELNSILYMHGASTVEEDDRLAAEIIERQAPEFKPENKAVIVDDFAGSGGKSQTVLERLSRIGYRNVAMAVFVGSPSREYHEQVYLASKDRDLLLYLGNLAEHISLVRKEMAEIPQQYYPYLELIKKGSTQALKRIVRYLKERENGY